MDILTVHRVRRADRLEALSAYYRVPVCMIMRANSFSSPEDIFTCRAVKIPGRDYCLKRGCGQCLQEEYRQYTVKEEDTLFGIARMFGVTMNILIKANGLKSAQSIIPGDTLIIPPPAGVMHCVRAGETIEDIARKYGVSVKSIKDRNRIAPGEHVLPGMMLILK